MRAMADRERNGSSNRSTVERTGAMILATRNREGTFDTTPSASDRIRAGDTLIVLGTGEQISRLERLMKVEEAGEGS
jgi:K+/H+ antiporter YhaU regulatory subunit KhtT